MLRRPMNRGESRTEQCEEGEKQSWLSTEQIWSKIVFDSRRTEDPRETSSHRLVQVFIFTFVPCRERGLVSLSLSHFVLFLLV